MFNSQKSIELTDVLLSIIDKTGLPHGFTVNGIGFPKTENQYEQMVVFDSYNVRPLWSEVLAEYKTLQEKADKEQYIYQRAAEYPSLADQLDIIFHDGVTAWKEQIQAIKDKYPKP